MILEPKLIQVVVIQRAKLCSQATKCADKRELHRDDVHDDTEWDVIRELETSLSLTLHLGQRISGRKNICNQMIAAICCKSEVADPVRCVEGAPHELSSCLDVSLPWHDAIPKTQIGASLIAVQPTLLHQIVAYLAKAESCLIVSETRPSYQVQPFVGEARSALV